MEHINVEVIKSTTDAGDKLLNSVEQCKASIENIIKILPDKKSTRLLHNDFDDAFDKLKELALWKALEIKTIIKKESKD